MGPADRLLDDPVDHAERHEILRRELERLGRLGRARGVLPQDRGAAFGADHRVDGVREHGHAIGGGQRHRTAGAALADDDRDDRHLHLQAGLDGAGDRLGLASLLGALARIGARRVNQRHHRQAEAVGEAHQADRLAVALGPGHAEVVVDAALGVAALLGADHHHRPAVEARQPAENRGVLGEVAVSGQRGELREQPLDVVARMGPLRMARDLALLPAREVAVEPGQHRVGLLGQRLDLARDVHLGVLAREGLELGDLALDLGEGLLELEIVFHASDSGGCAPLCRAAPPRATARVIAAARAACPVGARRAAQAEAQAPIISA